MFRLCCVPRVVQAPVPLQSRVLLLALSALTAGHAGLLVAQVLSLSQIDAGAAAWLDLLRATHVGRVWLLRALVLALLFVLAACAAWLPRWPRALPACCALVAALYLALGVWGGHAAGAQCPAQVLPANIVHVLAVSAWIGALPAWLATVRAFARADAAGLCAAALATTLERFSRLAMGLMLAIVATGLWLANRYVETAGDLLGTRYGALLVGKLLLLGLVLALANRLRTRFLPTLRTSATRASAASALRHAGAELLAALGILGCAAWLAQTTPALHEIAPRWWLPFRWSIAATWEQEPALRAVIVGALLVALIGLAAAVLLRGKSQRLVAALGVLIAAGVLAWAIAVPAFPDTYLRSQVPYLSLSVASGRALYAEHCVACHGSGGLGDGPLASSLPRPPANLSEPHTALHTVGDMHWWLVHGIPQSGMPGLGAVLSEDDRWDLINFLRAFSQGYQSRILRAQIVPGQAWLGAINFYIENDPAASELKGYRETHNVLLAFLGGTDAAPRARELAAVYPELQRHRTQVLLAPLDSGALPPGLPVPVLGSDAAGLWSAYELLSRTAGDRGRPDALGMDWTHAEFLIDRFGYVRARWIAQDDPAGWRDLADLYPELKRLNAEPRLRPAPDDHLH